MFKQILFCMLLDYYSIMISQFTSIQKNCFDFWVLLKKRRRHFLWRPQYMARVKAEVEPIFVYRRHGDSKRMRSFNIVS